MRYRLRHYTHYRYDEPAEQAHNQVRMLLRETPWQHCTMRSIRIRPRPAWSRLQRDGFDNRLLYLELDRPHRDFRIFVTHEVELRSRDLVAGESTENWQSLAQRLAEQADVATREQVAYLFPSALVPTHADLVELAKAHFRPGRPVLEAALALNSHINKEFEFDATATSVSTPVSEVLKRRRGVCQDFSHLLIAALRSLGLAARYVSGYIETLPPPGRPRLVGADASHAWVSLWCGDAGWQDLDPTNNSRPDQQHITTAWGRDYEDVIPLNGVVSGAGKKTELEVKVDVLRL